VGRRGARRFLAFTLYSRGAPGTGAVRFVTDGAASALAGGGLMWQPRYYDFILRLACLERGQADREVALPAPKSGEARSGVRRI